MRGLVVHVLAGLLVKLSTYVLLPRNWTLQFALQFLDDIARTRHVVGVQTWPCHSRSFIADAVVSELILSLS